jgi:hypothetical protein
MQGAVRDCVLVRKLIEDLPKEHKGHPLNYVPSPYDPRDYKYFNLIGAVADEPAVSIDY